MSSNFTPVSRALAACLLLVVGHAVPAQTAPAPSTGSTSSSPAPGDTVVLSPFEVNSTADVGYLATNTLAGSRFNTALKDTPASISVLTPEFLSDIGAFDLSDAMAYAVNVEFQLDDDRPAINGNATFQGYQEFRVRGLNASVSRNYFAWNGPAVPSETAFTARIEDSRGPNSVLFGIASPGGVINVMTKQPQTGRAFRAGSFSLGSYDSKRAAIDVNQPALNGKFALRLNLVYNDTNEFRHWQHQTHLRGHLGAKYNFNERTRIRAEFERGQLESNQPRSFNLDNRFLRWNNSGRPTFATQAANAGLGIARLPTAANQPRVTYISNDDLTIAMRGVMITTGDVQAGEQTPGGGVIGSGVITDRSISDYSVNVGGPAQNRFSRYGIFSAFFEHQLGRNSFLEIAYNHLEHSFDNRDPRQDAPNALKGDPNQLLNTGATNPFAGGLYLETNWFRTRRWDISDTGRATYSTEFDAKQWGNYRVAVLGEYDKSFANSTTYREFWVDAATGQPAFNPAPENAQNNVWRRTYVMERDWASYHVSGPIGSGGLLTNVRDPVTGRTLNSAWLRQNYPNETFSTKKTYMIAAQARYFDGKLILAGGLRRDDLDDFQVARFTDPVTRERSLARNPAEADLNQEASATNNVGRTKTFGVVYHVTPQLSVFYNQADNVGLPGRGSEILPPSGEPGRPLRAPAPKGKGQDVGVGFDLLQGRLYAKATYYTTEGKDQSTTSPAMIRNANIRIMDALLAAGQITAAEHERRTNVGGEGLFDHKSDGFEFQVTANPTRSWRLQANYALTDAVEENKFLEWKNWEAMTTPFLQPYRNVVTASGDTIAEEIELYQGELRSQTESDGLGKLGNRRHKVSLVTRYGFSTGWLRGAYIGGAYRHQSKMYTGLDPVTKAVVHSNSYWRADLLAGYTVQGLRNNRRLSFQLNVFNLFNERDPLVTRFADDGSVFREVVQPPTTWRFTTNFEF